MTAIRIGSRTLFEMNESIYRLNIIKVDGRWAEFRDMLMIGVMMDQCLATSGGAGIHYAAHIPWCSSRKAT